MTTGRQLRAACALLLAALGRAVDGVASPVIGVFAQCLPALFEPLQAPFEQRVAAVLGQLFQGVDQGVKLLLMAASLGVPGL